MIKIQNLKKEFRRNISKTLWKKYFNPTYDYVKAVTDLSLEINQGESVAFLGPNGAGKTTTIKMLTGILYPTSGEISVLGFKPFERKNEFLKQIGIVMGNKSGLNWDLSPMQSFELIKDIYEIKQKDFIERLNQLVDVLNVKHVLHSQVRTLSLGERMKVEIIGSILHRPKILFLDEPTIGLDIDSKHRIRDFLRRINKEYNITLMLTSHDMDDIELVSDRVVIINKGKKIFDKPIYKLYSEFGNSKTIKIHLKKLEDKAIINGNYKEFDGENFTLTGTFQSDRVSNVVADILNTVDVDDIDIEPIKLEKLISQITYK